MEAEQSIDMLYEHLHNTSKDHTDFNNIDELAALLQKLDEISVNVLGLLIKKYYEKEVEQAFSGTKMSETHAKFDIRNFSPVFQHMMYTYTKMHNKRISTL